jgi:hypothetical protein
VTDAFRMLDSGAALAEPVGARLPLRGRRSLPAANEQPGSLPELLDIRRVRAELMRMRAPVGAGAGIFREGLGQAIRSPAAADEVRAG